MEKKEKVIEIVPKQGVYFKRFIVGRKVIEFEGKPPYKVSVEDFQYIKDYFDMAKKGGK